jgi:uncharacterized protein (TIGR03790 family)
MLSRSQIVCCVFAVLLLTFGATSAVGQSLAERVLVVYNANVPASQEVADYYVSKRGIPAANKCAIAPSDAAAVDWYEFETKIKTPLKSCLNAVGKERILYLVLAYQTPFRLHNVPVAAGRELRALDSFLADLWNDKVADVTELTSHAYFADLQSQGNVSPPFVALADYRNQAGAALLYSVWRLDAATIELAKGLVDKALQAEANGKRGKEFGAQAVATSPTFADCSAGLNSSASSLMAANRMSFRSSK